MKLLILLITVSFNLLANPLTWFESKLVVGHNLTPFKTGPELHSARNNLILGAKKSIYITAFSLSTDETGQLLLNQLCHKAQNKVDVRIIYDHRNSIKWYDNAHTLRSCGA